MADLFPASQIDRVLKFAEGMQQPVRILECECSEESARRRLEDKQAAAEHPAANRGYSLYLEVNARFEPITQPKIVLDTDQPLDDCVNLAMNALR